MENAYFVDQYSKKLSNRGPGKNYGKGHGASPETAFLQFLMAKRVAFAVGQPSGKALIQMAGRIYYGGEALKMASEADTIGQI